MSIFRKIFHRSEGVTKPAMPRPAGADSRNKPLANAGTVSPLRTWLPAKLLSPVEDGFKLLDDITAAVRDHVVMPHGAAETIALFALHAHAHDAAQFSPLLAIRSPDSECGKTTLLRVLGKLTPSPLSVANVTAAGLYRTISWRKHMLLIDEADTILIGKNELRGILNSGHCRDSAQVLRADGTFNVWCPKAMALIGELPTTLRNRSLLVTLKRKRPEETVTVLDRAALARLQRLGERAAVWVAQYRDQLAAANPAMPPELTNRIADNWAALLAIADLAGGRWPQLARLVAVRCAAEARADMSAGVALLGDVRKIFLVIRTDRIPTTNLIEALNSMEDRPWCEWRGRQAITASQLAHLLKPYGICPKTIRFESFTAKGYLLTDFADAFGRYL